MITSSEQRSPMIRKRHGCSLDAEQRGVSERKLQAFLGHQDVRSTRRYAQLQNTALIEVLRQPVSSPTRKRGTRFKEE